MSTIPTNSGDNQYIRNKLACIMEDDTDNKINNSCINLQKPFNSQKGRYYQFY
ncbi:MAG: hypothetical protein ACTHKF_08870 [Candidatus Nitrosocosmicus sp.]